MRGQRLRSDSHCVLSVDSRLSIDDDEIQASLAPYIQTYLSHSTSSNTCGCLPVPFERAAQHSWIRPCFDSEILEGQFRTSSSSHFLRRFRYALSYLIGVSTLWLCFSIYRYPGSVAVPVLFALLLLLLAITYLLSKHWMYHKHSQLLAGCVAILLVTASLLFTALAPSTLSHFVVVCYTIIVIYTIFPLPPYVSLIICVAFSVAFQVLEYFNNSDFVYQQGLLVRFLCLICINMIGFHIVVMFQVRMRGTFMKVGQRLLVRRQLEAEKQLKEKMIHSVMPPKVASWLLNPSPSLSDSHSTSAGDIRSLFRPFNMVRMENVSILFADIVGFTKMSSNKTAEQIVDILNDLFNRFDELCIINGCEKISTLGDCYYCVSGCPEPRDDHAKCCVEMGLGMIDAIQEFDIERSEDVNMRVGVHTGTVLCGVVGTRRFKFDVWSNDVSLANKLESTGQAGRVHVSQNTVDFLDGAYKLEPYDAGLEEKSYLIEPRAPPTLDLVQMTIPSSPNRSSEPTTKYSSPGRTRINSCNAGNKRPHYLSLITNARTKFASLPNVLDSSVTGRVHGQGDTEFVIPTRRRTSSIRWLFPFPKSWREPQPDIINLEPVNRLEVPKDGEMGMDEEVSLCPSATSRKDSGIKSTSRRSSIQHQIYLMNGLGQQELISHRVSGYFTSSRSSLPHSESECDMSEQCRSAGDDGLGTCFYSLRKQSDLQLIRCVRDITDRSYFVKVPLRPLTLRFRTDRMERDYRAHAHHIDENLGDSPVTLSTARYNTFLDMVVSTVVLVCVVASLLILFRPSTYLAVVVATALFAQLFALALCSLYLAQDSETKTAWRSFVVRLFSDWYPWHVLGSVLATLPVFLSLTTFGCAYTHHSYIPNKNLTDFLEQTNLPEVEFVDFYYTFVILSSLTHFCNFTQLNSLLKNCIATVSIVVFVVLTFVFKCVIVGGDFNATVLVGKFLAGNVFLNESVGLVEVVLNGNGVGEVLKKADAQYFELGESFLDAVSNGGAGVSLYVTESGFRFLEILNSLIADYPGAWRGPFLSAIAESIVYDHYELVFNLVIVLVLVVLLNRELETNYRASYFFNVESNKDKIHVQHLKNQADMLLENIIPKHVSVELKNRAKYCENHTDVGIIFASIVNFNKLYDETYSGGKEYLRYLNELISDFDELLKRFSHVEKIKTIGSTFMAASGLNPELRRNSSNPYEHIYELMEFAKAMYKVVDEFNGDLLGFNLVLRVGFNIGEVTAGVIGSTKLLYDIWGDTVNVASRMDSTGVDGRIQVPFSCLKHLSDRYSFEQRGSVFVKGKGDIMVYLLQE